MVSLTRAGVALTGAGFGLLALGISMANLELLVFSAFPLLLLALALAGRPLSPPRVERAPATVAPRRGQPFDVAFRVTGVPEGCLVEAHAPLPPSFTLDAGNNVALLGADRAATFRVSAHARGSHPLPPARVEAIDPTGLVAPLETEAATSIQVNVAPRAFPVRKLRARAARLAVAQTPDQDEARLGMSSTDFRELREYAWGDAPNKINWKATARRLSAMGKRGGRLASPLVNEYEKEGKRTVFILLDGGEPLRVGTSLETGLDHGVEAAVAAARFFLARGSRVGAWTYGARSGPVAPPEAGSGHAASVDRALSPGDVDAAHTLPVALRAIHSHLVGARPLLVVVTRLTPANAEEVAEAAQRLRLLTAERRRSLPMAVVDVRALTLAPATDPAWRAARDIVEREDAEAARLVRATGARIVPWRPGAEDFRRALHKGGLA